MRNCVFALMQHCLFLKLFLQQDNFVVCNNKIGYIEFYCYRIDAKSNRIKRCRLLQLNSPSLKSPRSAAGGRRKTYIFFAAELHYEKPPTGLYKQHGDLGQSYQPPTADDRSPFH